MAGGLETRTRECPLRLEHGASTGLEPDVFGGHCVLVTVLDCPAG